MKEIPTQMLPIGLIEPNKGQIEGLPKNPRLIRDEHFKKLKKSIEDNPEMLYLRELLVYPHQGKYVVIGGNMRLMAMKDLGYTEAPCKVIPEDTTVEQLKAYTIKDNAAYGEWDYDLLANEWDEVQLEDWCLDIPDTKAVNPTAEAHEDDFDPDKPVETVCKKGDIWKLGNHRLMCGDSTDAGDVDLLMDGKKATLFLTDPPYGVSYGDKNAFLNAMAKGNRIQEPIANDHHSEEEMFEIWKKCFKLAYEFTEDCMAYYVFGAQCGELLLLLLLLLLSLKEANLAPRHGLVWVKNNHVLGRADYNYKHEPITYGWKTDGSHKFYAKFDTSVFEDELDVDKMKKDELVKLVKEMLSDKVPTSVIHENKPLKNDLHPTMKPVALIGRLMNNSSREGEIVLDLFGGSGTTLIAAEQLGRKCYMMELDPHYCDVIIARWEKYTGEKAEKVQSAKPSEP